MFSGFSEAVSCICFFSSFRLVVVRWSPFERPWHHALKAHQPFSCLRFGGSRSARLKRAEELSPPRWTSETRQFLAATTSLHSFEHVFLCFFAFTAICWIAILFQYRFLRLSYGSAISKVSVWGGQMPLACRRSPVDGYQELSGHSACVFFNHSRVGS